jgi:hypothetical protein
VVLVSFFAMIPAAPGYVGTFDAAALFGLNALGVAGGAGLGCVPLYRFVLFVPMTVLGLIHIVTRFGGLRGVRLRDRERAATHAPATPDDDELRVAHEPRELRSQVASR